jgi:mono/diheme cytochrome c family protein
MILIIWLLSSCINQTPQHGKRLYEKHCSGCHGVNGRGLEALIPPLKGNPHLIENQSNLPCLIRFGISDTLQIGQNTFDTPMQGLPYLTEVEMANIINYLASAFDERIQKTTPLQIRETLRQCPQK